MGVLGEHSVSFFFAKSGVLFLYDILYFAKSGVSYSTVLTGVVWFGVTGGLGPKKDCTRRPFLSSGSYLELTEH